MLFCSDDKRVNPIAGCAPCGVHAVRANCKKYLQRRVRLAIIFGMSVNCASVPAGLARRKQLLLVVLAGVVATVGGLVLLVLGAGSVSAQGSATSFVPNVDVSVPQFPSSGTNFLSGTRFGITYSRVEGSDVGCTESATERYQVGSGGVVSFVSGRSGATLVDSPVGSGVSCEYVVALAHDSPSKLRLVSGDEDLMVDGDNDADGDAVAVSLAGLFSPAVKFTVPSADGIVGMEFRVGFSPTGSAVGCSELEHTYVVRSDRGIVAGGTRVRTYNFPVLVDVPSGGTARCSYQITFPEYTEPVPGATAAADREPLYLQSNATATVSNSSATTRAAAVVYRADHGHSGTATSFDPIVTVTVPAPAGQGATSEFSGARIWLSYSSDTQGCRKKVFEKYSVNSTGAVTAVGNTVRLDIRSGGAVTGDFCEYVVDFAKSSNDLLGLGSDITRPHITEATTNQEDVALVVVFSPALSFTVPLPDLDGDGEPDYEGTQFTVTYNGTQEGCTSETVENYGVGTEGNVVLLNPHNQVKLTKFPADRLTGSFCHYSTNYSFQHRDGTSSLPNSLYRINARSLSQVTFLHRSPEVIFSTSYKFNLSIKVPVRSNSDGAKIRFTVAPILDSPSVCHRYTHAHYTVGYNGKIRTWHHSDYRPRDEIWLYDSPPNSTIRCKYRVKLNRNSTAESSYTSGLFLLDTESGSDTFILMGAMNLIRRYGTLLNVDVNFSLPHVVTNEGESSNIVGNTFDVAYEKVSDTPSGCRHEATETLTNYADGTAMRVGYSAKIIDRVPGESERCSYTLTFPEETGDLRFKSASLRSSSAGVTNGRTITVSHAERVVDVSYDKVFDPSVGVSFPNVDTDYGSVRSFSIEYRRTSPLRSGCTEMATDSYELAADGTLTPVAGVKLVDIPAGETTTCSYDISWPTIQDMSRQGNQLTNVNSSSGEITATYEPAFSPNVSFLLPDANVPSGTVLTVSYSSVSVPSNDCTTSASENYRVEVGGRISEPSDRASLVGGIGSECSYSVTWPDISGLRRKPDASSTVKISAKNISVKYSTVFSSGISVSVPAGSYGDAFAVTVVYARAQGADAGCSDSAREVFNVASDGSVTSPDPRASLVDRVAGVSEVCSYLVTFLGADSSLEALGSSAVSYSSASSSLTFKYATRFVSDVTVSVPGDFSLPSGVVFTVSFARTSVSDSGCSELAREFHGVGGDGNIGLLGDRASLVDRVGGAASACSYDVVVSSSSDKLVRNSGSIMAISATDKERSVAFKSMFSASVTIDAPNVDANGNGATDFLGVVFTVKFTNKPSLSECTDSVTRLYEVGAGGVVEPQTPDSEILLVGYVAGAVNPCSYKVNIISSDNKLEDQGNPGKVSAARTSVSATFVTMFGSPLAFSVPLVDANGDGIKDFSGTVFNVTYAIASGSADECSDPASETYQVGTDGTVDLQTPDTAVSFVGYVPGDNAVCNYEATLPSTSSTLVSQLGTSTSFNASTKKISAKYATEFEVDVTVSVLRLTAAEIAQYAGTRFMIDFEPHGAVGSAGPPENCSEVVTRTYEMSASGSVSISGGDLKLVDYPAGGTEPCNYHAKFPKTSTPKLLGLDDENSNPVASEDGTKELIYAINRGSSSATVKYSKIVYFSLSGTIDVYWLDANSNSEHDLAGRNISIGVEPDIEASYMCEKGKLEYTIQTNGLVEPTGSADSFVKEEPGSDTLCEYDLVFSSSVDLMWQPGGTSTVDFDDDGFLATFTAGFAPDVAILVPRIRDSGSNVFHGTKFEVSFAQSLNNKNSSCSPSLEDVIYTVDSSGNIATDRDLIFVDYTWVKSSGVLARGVTCRYTATFEIHSVAEDLENAYGNLVLTTSMIVMFNGASPRAEALFNSYIVPNVSLKIPMLNNLDGNHRYSDAVINVRFSWTVDGCGSSGINDRNLNRNFVLQADGSIEPEGASISLKDGTAGETSRCSYRAIFPRSASGLDSLSLALDSSRFANFVGRQKAEATYDAKFTPGMEIILPASEEGSQQSTSYVDTIFDIAISPAPNSPSGCSQETYLSYTVVDGGEVNIDYTPQMIVDGFVDNSMNTVACNYLVTFEIDPSGILAPPEDSVEVSGSNPSPRVIFAAIS